MNRLKRFFVRFFCGVLFAGLTTFFLIIRPFIFAIILGSDPEYTLKMLMRYNPGQDIYTFVVYTIFWIVCFFLAFSLIPQEGVGIAASLIDVDVYN
jgi:predicted PurR-regulated permease PerM